MINMAKEETTPVKIKKFKVKDLEGKFLLVKVGTEDHPATDTQIKDVQEKLLELLESNNIDCVAFVTQITLEETTLIILGGWEWSG